MRPRVDGVVRSLMLVVVVLFVGAGVWAQEAAKAGGDGVEMEWGVKIPMRDGGKTERHRVSAAWTERWAAGDFHADAVYRGFVHGPGDVFCEAWLRVCAGGCAGGAEIRAGSLNRS